MTAVFDASGCCDCPCDEHVCKGFAGIGTGTGTGSIVSYPPLLYVSVANVVGPTCLDPDLEHCDELLALLGDCLALSPLAYAPGDPNHPYYWYNSRDDPPDEFGFSHGGSFMALECRGPLVLPGGFQCQGFVCDSISLQRLKPAYTGPAGNDCDDAFGAFGCNAKLFSVSPRVMVYKTARMSCSRGGDCNTDIFDNGLCSGTLDIYVTNDPAFTPP